ncbi:sce7725 family protein [Thiobacillus sp.]|uniref:sce7725 family protein n=1 Tax=Thiobacillus sp. TaxID=924 RepID=UPI00286E57BA|nr:sce7725 family protein [Thiobacillus sp.]
MYYPYFRGKQYELITIRENADRLAGAGFVPIIEPVRESLNSLKRALDAVTNSDGEAVLIVNPNCGEHIADSTAIRSLLESEFADSNNILAGIILSEELSVEDAIVLCNAQKPRRVALIHAGFAAAKQLAEKLAELGMDVRHIFLEDYCGKLYRKHFAGSTRVLLRDGFQKKKSNKLHPDVEFFSDLHITFSDEGMDGFGDFLIVGDDYSEGGGPAYTVAIHLSYIDPEKDEEMHVHHFKSVRQDTPTDVPGKFAEALEKLVAEVARPGTPVIYTEAVAEFMDLHKKGHFPGLGSVKKLSMKHHIETLAKYLSI